MPATYNLIASNTLSSSAASVTFSAIPGTYTDLVLRASIRGTWVGAVNKHAQLKINGSTSAVLSTTYVSAYGSTASSNRDNGLDYLLLKWAVPGTTSTSNTFTSLEIYFPNYLSTSNKVFSVDNRTENNSTTESTINAQAGLRSATDAISSFELSPASDSFASGSSFFLYGIKNS